VVRKVVATFGSIIIQAPDAKTGYHLRTTTLSLASRTSEKAIRARWTSEEMGLFFDSLLN